MAFIRKKKSFYYLVENKRVDGKVRQKVVCYLGLTPDINAAIQRIRCKATRFRRGVLHYAELETPSHWAITKYGYEQATAEWPQIKAEQIKSRTRWVEHCEATIAALEQSRKKMKIRKTQTRCGCGYCDVVL